MQHTAKTLLDVSTWEEGNALLTNFANFGSQSANNRSNHETPFGYDDLVWAGSADGKNSENGGFYSDYFTIDPSKTYRLVVWMKKTGSQNGEVLFGCRSHNGKKKYNTLHYIGDTEYLPSISSPRDFPYLIGDLPDLDKWYLLIAYALPVSQSNLISQIPQDRKSQLFDGQTHQPIQDMANIKFLTYAENLQFFTFLRNDNSRYDETLFYKPRLEEVNASMVSVEDLLLGYNPNSKLFFSYDAAGNQLQRFYCSSGSCQIPDPRGRVAGNISTSTKEVFEENELSIESKINLYPNPVKDFLEIQITGENPSAIQLIEVYGVNGMLLQKQESNQSINFRKFPTGIYYIHIHTEDGKAFTEKIVKQ